MKQKDSFLVIEAPTIGTVYRGHIVFSGNETDAKAKYYELANEMEDKVKQAQAHADEIAGPYGIAATHFAPSEFVIVNEDEWGEELEHRRNR